MGKSGRSTGVILIVVGVVMFLACSAVSFFSTQNVETGGSGGFVLGMVISLFVALPLLAAGAFLISRGRAEAASQADQLRLRKILDMVKTRGQVDISELVFELNVSTDQIRNDVYKLVGLGLFTGYVNWDKGALYSQEASKLTGNTCPNCGGEQAFVGKGVIACQYCGAEIFL